MRRMGSRLTMSGMTKRGWIPAKDCGNDGLRKGARPMVFASVPKQRRGVPKMGIKTFVVCRASLVPGPYFLSHLEKFLYRATHSLKDLMGLRGPEHIGRGGDDFVSVEGKNADRAARDPRSGQRGHGRYRYCRYRQSGHGRVAHHRLSSGALSRRLTAALGP